MIVRIKGVIVEKKDNAVILAVGGIFYEILVPASVAQRIDSACDSEGFVILVIHHYLQIGPSTAAPVMIGFLNELEKDFFLQFISVSGIGPKAAVKALNCSIADISAAIDASDASFLKGLPGIGQQKAKDIIAKLQGKVSRFGLIPDTKVKILPSSASCVCEEALAVLQQLQYRKAEAEEMVRKAWERTGGTATAEELLNAIYSASRKA